MFSVDKFASLRETVHRDLDGGYKKTSKKREMLDAHLAIIKQTKNLEELNAALLGLKADNSKSRNIFSDDLGALISAVEKRIGDNTPKIEKERNDAVAECDTDFQAMASDRALFTIDAPLALSTTVANILKNARRATITVEENEKYLNAFTRVKESLQAYTADVPDKAAQVTPLKERRDVLEAAFKAASTLAEKINVFLQLDAEVCQPFTRHLEGKGITTENVTTVAKMLKDYNVLIVTELDTLLKTTRTALSVLIEKINKVEETLKLLPADHMHRARLLSYRQPYYVNALIQTLINDTKTNMRAFPAEILQSAFKFIQAYADDDQKAALRAAFAEAPTTTKPISPAYVQTYYLSQHTGVEATTFNHDISALTSMLTRRDLLSASDIDALPISVKSTLKINDATSASTMMTNLCKAKIDALFTPFTPTTPVEAQVRTFRSWLNNADPHFATMRWANFTAKQQPIVANALNTLFMNKSRSKLKPGSITPEEIPAIEFILSNFSSIAATDPNLAAGLLFSMFKRAEQIPYDLACKIINEKIFKWAATVDVATIAKEEVRNFIAALKACEEKITAAQATVTDPFRLRADLLSTFFNRQEVLTYAANKGLINTEGYDFKKKIFDFLNHVSTSDAALPVDQLNSAGLTLLLQDPTYSEDAKKELNQQFKALMLPLYQAKIAAPNDMEINVNLDRLIDSIPTGVSKEVDEINGALQCYYMRCMYQTARFDLSNVYKIDDDGSRFAQLQKHFPKLALSVQDDAKSLFFKKLHELNYTSLTDGIGADNTGYFEEAAALFKAAEFTDDEVETFAKSLQAKFEALMANSDADGIKKFSLLLIQLADIRLQPTIDSVSRQLLVYAATPQPDTEIDVLTLVTAATRRTSSVSTVVDEAAEVTESHSTGPTIPMINAEQAVHMVLQEIAADLKPVYPSNIPEDAQLTDAELEQVKSAIVAVHTKAFGTFEEAYEHNGFILNFHNAYDHPRGKSLGVCFAEVYLAIVADATRSSKPEYKAFRDFMATVTELNNVAEIQTKFKKLSYEDKIAVVNGYARASGFSLDQQTQLANALRSAKIEFAINGTGYIAITSTPDRLREAGLASAKETFKEAMLGEFNHAVTAKATEKSISEESSFKILLQNATKEMAHFCEAYIAANKASGILSLHGKTGRDRAQRILAEFNAKFGDINAVWEREKAALEQTFRNAGRATTDITPQMIYEAIIASMRFDVSKGDAYSVTGNRENSLKAYLALYYERLEAYQTATGRSPKTLPPVALPENAASIKPNPDAKARSGLIQAAKNTTRIAVASIGIGVAAAAGAPHTVTIVHHPAPVSSTPFAASSGPRREGSGHDEGR